MAIGHVAKERSRMVCGVSPTPGGRGLLLHGLFSA